MAMSAKLNILTGLSMPEWLFHPSIPTGASMNCGVNKIEIVCSLVEVLNGIYVYIRGFKIQL